MFKQEVSKLIKQDIVSKQSGMLLLLIFGMSTFTKFSGFVSPVKMINARFNSGWLIVFFMVYLASQLFAMEFRYGTIKNLITMGAKRSSLFLAKAAVLVVYGFYLTVFAEIATLGTTWLYFPTLFSENTFGGEALSHSFASFIGMLLFASLSLLLSLVIKSDVLAGMVGIVSYFMASMIAGVQFILLSDVTWLKWNPFNMLNLANQLGNNQIAELTRLSTDQLLLGNLIYIVIFIFFAGIIFKHKRV